MKRATTSLSACFICLTLVGGAKAQTGQGPKDTSDINQNQGRTITRNVESIYEYRFPSTSLEEGLRLVAAVGGDMQPKQGYVSHTLVRDIDDPGHFMLVTRWTSLEEAKIVLAQYRLDPKIARLGELLPRRSPGFVGEVMD